MRIGPKILPPPKSKSPELLDFNVVKSPPGKNGVIRPPISSPSDESIGWVTEKGHWNPRALSSFQTFPRSAGNPLHLAVSNPTYEQPVTTTIWIDNDSRHPQQHHTLSSTPLRKSTPDQRPSRPRPRLLDSDMVKNVNGISNGGPLVSDHRHTKSEQLEPLNLSIGSHGDNHRMLIRMDGTRNVQVFMGPGDTRFGFSVIGGCDEGFMPIIDEISEGSPADRADLEIGDEILEVNGRSLDNCSHTDVIAHIHQCIRSRTICLRVKRRSGSKIARDLAQHGNVQDAFVIAVESQAKERLERLSALKKIKPVDMTALSHQLSAKQQEHSGGGGSVDGSSSFQHQAEINGFIEANPVYNISVPDLQSSQTSLNKLVANAAPDKKPSPLSPKPSPRRGVGVVNGEVEVHSEPPSSGPLVVANVVNRPPSLAVGTSAPSTTITSSGPHSSSKTHKPSKEVLLKNQHLTGLAEIEMRTAPMNGTLGIQAGDSGRYSSGRSSIAGSDIISSTVEFDERHHREMAVDVPEGFMARTKTPPRYPPPSRAGDSGAKHRRRGGAANGSVSSTTGIPPHPLPHPKNSPRRPSQEERIRKYEEEAMRRREAKAKREQEEEWLRNSLRSSNKLRALAKQEQRRSREGDVGHAMNSADNPAYEEDHVHAASERTASNGYDGVIDLQSLRDATQRLTKQLQLLDVPSSLRPVQDLLGNPDFLKALRIHNDIKERWLVGCPPTPVSEDLSGQAEEVVTILESLPKQSLLGSELSSLLQGHLFSHLSSVHDRLAQREPVPLMTPEEELLDRASHYTDDSVKIVRIDKTSEPLGATVRNEGDAVVIARVVRGGAAERSGLLHEGDEILEVNGVEMRGRSVNEVCDILAGMQGTLTFLVIPCAVVREERNYHRQNAPPVVHMRALFDYDPEEDLYIPCRELGISFSKGDILHIRSQEDPNWWQAFREGEEDHALAGLIPSKSFQEQREALKQSLVGEERSLGEKGHLKSSTLLCAKKSSKKKKRKMYNPSQSEDEPEEILTYEEVALYFPRANRKRPVVLIGPPNIGRHELRQMLMEREADRFSAAVPHTSRPRKDSEVDGQDYHFISRLQFEQDILSRKFVEHGEFEKQYYGTSLEAIRQVVNMGKICILNLHPQSLKILKNSDLKPYVVFVAPPNLDILKRNRQKQRLPVKDEELRDLIERAREMESKYGQYLDLTLVNVDLERTYAQLLNEINLLEREPQWVPASWVDK